MKNDTNRGAKILLSVLAARMRRNGVHPSCFQSQEQFDAWLEVADIVPPPPTTMWCEDCTEEYADSMRKVGLCKRTDIEFIEGRVVPGAQTAYERVRWLKRVQDEEREYANFRHLQPPKEIPDV